MTQSNFIAERAVSVTPSDTLPIPTIPFARRLYIGGAGNVTVVTQFGDTVTFVAFPAGQYLYTACKQVRATGTTATNIVAEY